MKKLDKTITIIGGGNMGKALSQGFLEKKLLLPSQVFISDHRRGNLKMFASQGMRVTTSNIEAVQQADIVILAVKPPDVAGVLSEIAHSLLPQTLLISICAGIPIAYLANLIGHDQPIVRAMPNTPVQIGLGITGWFANKYVPQTMKNDIKMLFSALGKEIEFSQEKLLNIVTAVSGSGPAYFYYFTESLIKGAHELGLSQSQAQKLVAETFLGSAQLLMQSNKSPEKLRLAVTSRRGTTEMATRELAREHLDIMVAKALQKAAKKAAELTKQYRIDK